LACSDLSTKPILVTTPLESTTGKRVDEDIAVVPILRAGMCCVPAMRELLPRARIYPLGMARDELTTLPSFYSCKLSGQAVDTAILTDPMLATGGSAVAASAGPEPAIRRNKPSLSFVVRSSPTTKLCLFVI
jgi:uracil phosphoribosyltransferase